MAVPLNSAIIGELEYLNLVMDALTEKQTKEVCKIVDVPMVDVDPADFVGLPTPDKDSWIMDDEIDEMKATYYPVRKD